MNPRVHIFVSMVFPLFSFIAAFDSSFYVVISFIISLANALARVASLEAKLKTTSKALKEADEKRAKELSAANVSADKVVKAAEARAIKAEKTLAEVSRRQAKCEEDVVKRLDDILTSVGSRFSFLLLSSTALFLFVDMPLLTSCIFHDAAKQLGEIIKLHLDNAKDPLLDTIGILESNCRMLETYSSELGTCFLAYLSGCSQRRRIICLSTILGIWLRPSTPWRIQYFS
jgi:hypothetical protein